MKTQKEFWDVVAELETAAKGDGKNYGVTLDDLDGVYEAIDRLFGVWEAGNFVKLCACLPDAKIKTVTRALRDLEDNNWMIDNVLAIQDTKYKENEYGYRRAYKENRYTRHNRNNNMDPVIKEFLSRHFIALTPEQKGRYGELRPSL